VALTFGNLLANARGAKKRLALDSSDRWLASLSPAHVGGVAMVARAAVLGSGLVLAGPFRAEAFRKMVEQGMVTHASLVPTMLRRFLDVLGDAPVPRTLRCLLIGGARANQELVREALDRGLPIALTYGMTETSSQVATASPELVSRKPGTVGPPLDGVELSFSHEGEIRVRGDTVAKGMAGADGWFPTGDLGGLDAQGHLWVTGRRTSRIISGGENVDPAEVEALLRTHPAVSEAAVVGVPDEEWGERVVAAVVTPMMGAAIQQELEELVRGALSPAKRPRDYVLVRDLPRNANGKVDPGTVRALFQRENRR
jgi:O-succinylbenzoic acid--CoA ligase